MFWRSSDVSATLPRRKMFPLVQRGIGETQTAGSAQGRHTDRSLAADARGKGENYGDPSKGGVSPHGDADER